MKENLTNGGKKYFFFCIEVAISNSKIIYEKINPNSKEDNLTFRMNFITQLITNLDISIDYNVSRNNFIPPIYRNRLHEVFKGKSSDCSYCKIELGKRAKTNIYCEICRKHLHPECFISYHKEYIYNNF